MCDLRIAGIRLPDSNGSFPGPSETLLQQPTCPDARHLAARRASHVPPQVKYMLHVVCVTCMLERAFTR